MNVVTDLELLRLVVPQYEGDPRALGPFAARMYGEMVRERDGVRGVGLSANQLNDRLRSADLVGVPLRMFVMLKTPRPVGFSSARVCINPKFVPASGAVLKSSSEMCLSLPGKQVTVQRYDSIVASWTDLKGGLRVATLHGVSSRCFQHEVDHLNGVTLLDH